MSVTALSPPDLDPFKIGTYFNNKVQDAIDWAADKGGGRIPLPPAIYTQDPNGIVLHGGVTLSGLASGPFDTFADPSKVVVAPTFPVIEGGVPFIRMQGQNNGLTDLLFYYPDQVPQTSSQPIAYPATIMIQPGASGARLARLGGINPWIFIDCETARVRIRDIQSGALMCGLIIDQADDYVFLDGFLQTTSYKNQPPANGSAACSLDDWAMSQRYGIQLRRVDSLKATNIGLWMNYCGIIALDSPNKNQTFSLAGYGELTNVDIDTCQYGVIGQSTDAVGGGFTFSNMNIGCADKGKAAIANIGGGAQPPLITWSTGAVRGTWANGSPIQQGPTGNVTHSLVRGLDI